MTWKVFVAIRRAKLGLSLLAGLSITLLWTSPAKAGTTITQSTCPVVIAQSGDYALATDVGPCAAGADGIDITASNVTLHLNAHTISGTATSGTCNNSDGIHVIGTPLLPVALVRILGTGTITNFATGLLAENSGGSFVKFVTVTANCPFTSSGFAIAPSSSMWKLDSNLVREQANSGGIVLAGNDNDVVHNDVNDEIELLDSSNNTIVNNIADNGIIGIDLISLVGGSNNNEIHANTTDNNTQPRSGAGPFGDGIVLRSGASSNNISGNKSFNNLIDMEDDNANCDSNKWHGNKFNTANQPCIQ
jgi:hypothetical protein